MEFTIEKKKDHIMVVHLKGRMIGEYETLPLAERLEDNIEDEFTRVVLDLKDLEYMNSSGLNFFLKLLTKVRRLDGEVVICSMNKLLETLLVTTKLGSFFTICPDLAAALEHLEKEKA
jgi:anti-anti-sigma factor